MVLDGIIRLVSPPNHLTKEVISMDDPIKKGATVRQVTPTVQGTVIDMKFDADSMSFKYLVQYQDGDDAHERWFTHAELAEVKPEA